MQQQTSTHEQSPRDIEAGLERDRDDVARAFSALRDRFSSDNLMNDATGLIRRNASNYTQVLDQAIRANPVALAVAGVGIAWLILGRRSSDSAKSDTSLGGTKYDAVTRWEAEGGPVDHPQDAESDHDWRAEADRIRDRAAKLFGQINAAARKGIAPVADLARHRTEVLSALTTDVRGAMGRGLEDMTETARSAALTARERAYELHVQAKQKSLESLEEHPLSTAVAIAGAGAVVGALLPSSSFEDRLLGPTRDQVVDELGRVLRDERQRISGSIQVAAQGQMSELSQSVPPRASGGPTFSHAGSSGIPS